MSHPVIDRVRQRTRGNGRHRAADEVLRLRAQKDVLLLLIYWLLVQLAQAAVKASRCYVAEEQAVEATRRVKELEAEVTALTSALANALSVSDLSQHPAVTETQPLPVVVLPLHLSPLASPSL
ncbi:hypothetical protein ABZY44_21830 [Streptomyces sp. NPDC006544]|uniref:hypothetical protein n=1 Tax=Streptomyces sp. NPDC006544 TaxID=3154583 RepID=UPI0033BFB1F8